MGNDVKLQLQLPVQSITSKRYDESKPSRQAKFQYLRLWQSGRHQFLMYFCNMTSEKCKEHKGQWPWYAVSMLALMSTVERFRPVDTKSKTLLKLEVNLPGMVRRNSKSKSPMLIPEHSAHSQVSEVGLAGVTDMEELTLLDCLIIEFADTEGINSFCNHPLRLAADSIDRQDQIFTRSDVPCSGGIS